jgi:hypothetical protein
MIVSPFVQAKSRVRDHVDPDGSAAGSHPPHREQEIGARATADVEDRRPFGIGAIACGLPMPANEAVTSAGNNARPAAS